MRKAGLWVLVAVVLALLLVAFDLFQPAASRRPEAILPYSDLLARAATGDVEQVVIDGHLLTMTDRQSRRFQVVLPEDPTLASRLAGQGVRVLARTTEDAPTARVLLAWLPALLSILVLFLGLRRIANELRTLRRVMEPRPGPVPSE